MTAIDDMDGARLRDTYLPHMSPARSRVTIISRAPSPSSLLKTIEPQLEPLLRSLEPTRRHKPLDKFAPMSTALRKPTNIQIEDARRLGLADGEGLELFGAQTNRNRPEVLIEVGE
jgi:hypothetical protein